MSTINMIGAETEHARLRQLAEGNKAWADDYQPGSFGCHELLDRTGMLAELVEKQIQNHPACVANAEWFQLAEQAAAALRELYQRVGAEHVPAD